MADAEEEPVHLDIKNLAILADQAHAGHPILIAQDFLGVAIPEDFNVGRSENPLLHGLGSPENIATDNHIYLVAEAGQIGGFFTGGIAAAHHRHILAAIEKAVAGGAGRYARPTEPGFRRKPQVFGRSARGDDQGFGLDLVFAIYRDLKRTLGQIGLRHGSAADIRPETLGLGAHLVHQFVGIYPVLETGIVLHDRRGRKLPAGLHALIQDRGQRGTGGIDRRRVPGRAASDNQTTYLFHCMLVFQSTILQI